MPTVDSLQSSMPHARGPGAAVDLLDAADLHFQTDRLPWQRSLRWVKPPRDRRRWTIGLVLATSITVLELVGFATGMRSLRLRQPAPPPPHANEVVQVTLIAPSLPPPPEPEPPVFERRPSKIAIAPPAVVTERPPVHVAEPSDQMTGRLGSAGMPVPAPQLFNPDGSVRLGAAATVVAPPPPKNARDAAKARWTQIETRGNPLDCKKTRFAKAFTPDLSLGDKVAGKYLKWVGLADGEAIAHRAEQRAQSGGCEPGE